MFFSIFAPTKLLLTYYIASESMHIQQIYSLKYFLKKSGFKIAYRF